MPPIEVRGVMLSYWSDGKAGLVFGAGTSAEADGLLESETEGETHTVEVEGREYTVFTSEYVLGVRKARPC